MPEGKESQFIPDPEKLKTPEQTQADLRLPPEVEETVMKKVDDINKKGTAFTSLRDLKINERSQLVKLKDVFELGLVGGQTGNYSRLDKKQKIDTWRSAAKKGQSKVWANIVGRDISHVDDAYWLRISNTDIGLIFSLDKYKEKIPEAIDRREGSSKSFRVGMGSAIGGIIDKALEAGFNPDSTMDEFKQFVNDNREKLGMTDETMKYINGPYRITEPDTGYVVSHRVPPRDFKGIIFRPVRNVTVGGMDEFAWGEIEADDQVTVDKKFRTLVAQMMESYAEKPELLLPIYDQHGNLLWPKQMKYAEVRKLEKEKLNK